MKLFSIHPEVHTFDSAAQFCAEMQIGKGDLVISNAYILHPAFDGALQGADVLFQEKYGTGEPSDRLVENMAKELKGPYRRVFGIGGGSVIDCAKFISLGSGLGEDEDLWYDYVETGKPAPENLVPLGVVLTTAVTGSEMGGVAVLTNWARNRKLGYTSFPLTPKFSVLDPTYLLTLPAEQTTYGFVDMFCHTCEQYFSLPSDDNLSDEMAEAIHGISCAPGAPAVAIRAVMRPVATRCGIPRSRSTASSRVARRRIGSRTASSMRSPPTSTSRTAPAWPWSIHTG